jgi:hypothetical protein
MRNSYTDSSSKNGGFSTHIGVSTTQRMKDHCKRENICCTRFIEECVIKELDRLEEESYRKLSREDLISVILELKANAMGRGENA